MAKKKSKPTKKTAKKAFRSQISKAAKPVKAKAKAAKRARIASPRSQPLPGMEQIRNKTLDRICEHISDVRREMNRARGEEKDLVNQAVTVMTDTKTTAYRFSGVELVLVPGDVHLRVRLLKEGSSAEPAEVDENPQAATVDEMTEEPEDTEGAPLDDDGN